uniref:Uncharacterized protein n=1 Tax=Oryzias latipes TaxID=8090 RepID=A0A3P9IN26_ORYLA
MCTTMMVLTTIALILRQMFSNKIKPPGKRKGALQSPKGMTRYSCSFLFISFTDAYQGLHTA